jgi:hypothetical protein
MSGKIKKVEIQIFWFFVDVLLSYWRAQRRSFVQHPTEVSKLRLSSSKRALSSFQKKKKKKKREHFQACVSVRARLAQIIEARVSERLSPP